jgi:hypothetical protein
MQATPPVVPVVVLRRPWGSSATSRPGAAAPGELPPASRSSTRTNSSRPIDLAAWPTGRDLHDKVLIIADDPPGSVMPPVRVQRRQPGWRRTHGSRPGRCPGRRPTAGRSPVVWPLTVRRGPDHHRPPYPDGFLTSLAAHDRQQRGVFLLAQTGVPAPAWPWHAPDPYSAPGIGDSAPDRARRRVGSRAGEEEPPGAEAEQVCDDHG